MKKNSFSAAVLVGLLCAACSASKPAASVPYQTPSAANQASATARGGERQQMLQELSTRLSLTPEQQPKVTAILQEQVAQLQQARANAGGDRQQMIGELRRVSGATDDKMKAVLTPEQYGQYQTYKQEQLRARRAQR